MRSRSFRFVVIDEAFGRGSDESAQYGLSLFPAQPATADRHAAAENPHHRALRRQRRLRPQRRGTRLELRNLTIEEYREEKARFAVCGGAARHLDPPGRSARPGAEALGPWRVLRHRSPACRSSPYASAQGALLTRISPTTSIRCAPGSRSRESCRRYASSSARFAHRVLGPKSSLPDALWLESLEDALILIGKRREAARFQSLLEMQRRDSRDWNRGSPGARCGRSNSRMSSAVSSMS